MSKKNNIKQISNLFTSEYAILGQGQEYRDNKSSLLYTCRYGEQHNTTLSSWKRGIITNYGSTELNRRYRHEDVYRGLY